MKAIQPASSRLGTIFCVALYAICFLWMYDRYLAENWEYMGFTRASDGFHQGLLGLAFAILPAAVIPLRFTRPSQIIWWTLYLIVYLPSVLIPYRMGLRSMGELSVVNAALFGGLMITGCSYFFPKPQLPLAPVSSQLFWSAFALLLGVAMITILALYWGRFKLVSFANVYEEIRFTGGARGENALVGYCILATGYTLLPLLFSIALLKERYWMAAAAFCGQLLLYSTAGDKIYVLAPLMLAAFNKALPYFRRYSLGVVFPLGLSGLTVVGMLLATTEVITPGSGPDLLLSILFVRILAIGGLLTGQYHDFFSDHSLTYYSHINVVGKFIHYPYDRSVGLTVGQFYSGNADLNSNAHFWAMDGIAALGTPGIIVASLLCAIMLVVFDSLSTRSTFRLLALYSVPVSLLICNVSLFTALLSGGLLIGMMLVWVSPVSLVPEPGEIATRSGISLRRRRDLP